MNETKVISKRGLLKSAVFAGAGVLAAPKAVLAAPRSPDSKKAGPMASGLANLEARRTLGRGSAALSVSALSYGCLGLQAGRGVTPDEKATETLIRQAHERGCDFFDTAEAYAVGRNEELLGRAIAPIRDQVIIGTKFSVDLTRNPPLNDNRPERIRAACEGSLRRLKTDRIDLYHQHRIDRSVPIEDVAGTVADLIREGKVRYWGLSEVGAETIRRAHREHPLTTVQSEYHLMFRKPESEIFSTLQQLGIGFTAHSPVNKGFLGGGLTEYSDMQTNDIRGSWPPFQPASLRANMRILQVLLDFGKPRGMTSAQVAIAWMMSKHPFVVPLFGTSKLAHLEENVRAADFAFTPAEIEELEQKVAAFPVVGARYDAIQQAGVEY
jgi:aryl-alcohol dehydrogenase-like predicted oxidoreductase